MVKFRLFDEVEFRLVLDALTFYRSFMVKLGNPARADVVLNVLNRLSSPDSDCFDGSFLLKLFGVNEIEIVNSSLFVYRCFAIKYGKSSYSIKLFGLLDRLGCCFSSCSDDFVFEFKGMWL